MPDHIQSNNPRGIALDVLCQVEAKGAYADLSLDYALRQDHLVDKDRRLASELIYGALRRRNTLDWALELFSKRKLSQVDLRLRNLLRLGAYQLMFLDRVPPWAAVDESVKLAKSTGPPGSDRFINAVLRTFDRRKNEIAYPSFSDSPLRYISLCYSHPEWMVERWRKRYGPQETIELCEANNRPPSIPIRANRLRTDREALAIALKKEGVLTHASKMAPDGLLLEGRVALDKLAAYREGLFYIQDEASMLAAYILDPKPGQVVLDLCSAPGGKTTHLAELMGNRGAVIALDIKEGRLKVVNHNCLRLGINIVETRHLDGRKVGRIDADRVLVDAPCSGLGTIRHHPDIKWNKSADDIPLLARMQMELLAGGARNLKVGGVMVYSTCSIEPEENEGVIKKFLSEHVNFHLETIEFAGLKSDGALTLYPHRHGSDGFFIARLVRLR